MTAVSIITCIHNQRERFFIECTKSVAVQEGEIEWIIVDDCSSHHMAGRYREIVKDLCSDIPVTIITLAHQSGLSRARNAAIRRAEGEWIVVLDSDDSLSTGLCTALACLPRRAQMACFETRYFNEDSSEHRRIAWFEDQFRSYGLSILDPFLWFDFYYHGIIARRMLLHRIGGYLDRLTVGEDQDILLRATEALGIDQLEFVHSVGYEYRENPDGVCSCNWPEVEHNYTSTMLESANRRSADFTSCKLAGVMKIDGGTVDRYEYKSQNGKWLSWHKWHSDPAALA